MTQPKASPPAPLITRERYPNAGAYVRQWQRVNAQAIEDQGKTPRPKYPRKYGEFKTAEAYRREYAKALQNRINQRGDEDKARRGEPVANGRKFGNDYEAQAARDADRLRQIGRRVRVYQFETKEAKNRFAHLLARHDD